MICGSGSLPREDEEQQQQQINHKHQRATKSAESSPRKSSSSPFSRRIKSHKNHDKNPYAARGLDKFVALLAEIEEKKQIIYSKNNPDEICLVQFDYSKDNNCKPVVIKFKPKNHKADHEQMKKQSHDLDAATADVHHKIEAPDHAVVEAENKKSLVRRLKLQRLRQPGFYLPAILIMILLFLVFFGRSMAILCTSIGWYAIPAISNWNLNSTRSLKKKDSRIVC